MSKIKVDVLETVDGTKTVNVADLGRNIPGDLAFTGTAQRIQFPAIGLPVGNRTLFQSSSGNEATYIGVIPSGTARAAGITFSNSSDPDNAGYGYISMTDVNMTITSGVALGTGGTGGTPGAVPLVLGARGASMVMGDGAVFVTNGTLGYGAAMSGSATQTISRTSPVTLNKQVGTITLVSAAGNTGWLTFQVNNALVQATDFVAVAQISGTDRYITNVTEIGNGSFKITFVTVGGTTTEQPIFRFYVLKGAAA